MAATAPSSDAPKVKLLCSFGGKILPRPSDGALRYAGGHTRILSLRRPSTLSDLLAKIGQLSTSPITAVKYQLPDEDLDSLISISSQEDLDNMMEEFDRICEIAPDGGGSAARMRIFLFSPSDLADAAETMDTGQSYIDAVNGIGLRRKDSLVSIGSSEGMLSPSVSSPTHHHNDQGFFGEETGGFDRAEAQQVQFYNSGFNVHPIYVNAASFKPEINVVEGNLRLNQVEESLYRADQNSSNNVNNAVGGNNNNNSNNNRKGYYPHQPLSQLPPLHPTHFQQVQTYVPPLRPYPHQTVRFEDCQMCQKSLPHAHSDTLVSEHANDGRNGPGNGAVHEARPVLQSHHSEGPMRLQTSLQTENMAEPRGEIAAAVSSGQFARQHENPRVVNPNVEALDHAKGMNLNPIRLQAPPRVEKERQAQNAEAVDIAKVSHAQSAVSGNFSESVMVLKVDNMTASSEFGASGYPQFPKKALNHDNQSLPRNPNVSVVVGIVGETQTSYDYIRPVSGMMESLHVRAYKPSGTIADQRAAAVANHNVPTVMPENSRLAVDNNQAFRAQAMGNAAFYGHPQVMSALVSDRNYAREKNQSPVDLKSEQFLMPAGGIYPGNAFVAQRISPQEISIRSINQMVASSKDSSCVQSLQPSESSQTSVMVANHGPLISYNQEMRFQPEVPNEHLLMMPTYSSGIASAYNNNSAIDAVTVGDRKHEGSLLHNKDAFNNNAGALNGTTTVGSNGHADQFQGQSPSDLLFSNQDPQRISGKTQVVSPSTSKLPNKEFVAIKELCSENHSVNSKDSDVAILTEEGRFHQGEENDKQETQSLVDKGTVLAHQAPLPLAPNTFPQERVEAGVSSYTETGFIEGDTDIQSASAVGDHKIEAKKTNSKFPFTDDIGRLQVIKNGDLEELRELGSGTFGTVYHGKWRGSDVAIKRINEICFAGKPLEEERMRTDFWNEACMLAGLHHPNVVAFYGVVLDGPGGTFATVTEFMVNGSLRRALRKNDKSLDRWKRLLIAMDVAFGMEYLHGKKLIHFDLKSDNLLVNLRDPQRPICKVADLGLSKVKCQTLISGGVRGTLPWMAPELLNGGSTLVSDKVDVFSFGIVLWELLTGEEPYADLHYGAIIGGIVSNTLRPPVPQSCDPEWRSLMEQCWSAEPLERPTFTEIVNRLRSMATTTQKG